MRWVSSKSRAIHAIKSIYKPQSHICNMPCLGRGQQMKLEKLKNYLSSVDCPVPSLHAGFFSIISATSRIFQSKDLLLLDVPQTIEYPDLNCFRQNSVNTEEFYKNFN